MKWARWFVAGTLAVPLFHQVMLALLVAIGMTTYKPFQFMATKPFGVPQLISLSFWGGVWGLILGLVLLRVRSSLAYWTIATIFGAIAPTLVAGLVVAPLNGMTMPRDPKMVITGLLVNAAWGVGTALLYRLMDRRR